MAPSVCVWELFCSLSKYGVCEMSLEWSPDFQPPYICMCMHVYLYYCYYSFPTISLIVVFNLKGCFLCREGNEFSPVVGFFIYTSPSEVCKTCFLCSNVCARTRNIFLIPITALPYMGFFFLEFYLFYGSYCWPSSINVSGKLWLREDKSRHGLWTKIIWVLWWLIIVIRIRGERSNDSNLEWFPNGVVRPCSHLLEFLVWMFFIWVISHFGTGYLRHNWICI